MLAEFRTRNILFILLAIESVISCFFIAVIKEPLPLAIPIICILTNVFLVIALLKQNTRLLKDIRIVKIVKLVLIIILLVYAVIAIIAIQVENSRQGNGFADLATLIVIIVIILTVPQLLIVVFEIYNIQKYVDFLKGKSSSDEEKTVPPLPSTGQ